MLEDLKSKWNDLFYQQSNNMKDMIQSSVNEAITKKKEESKSAKKLRKQRGE